MDPYCHIFNTLVKHGNSSRSITTATLAQLDRSNASTEVLTEYPTMGLTRTAGQTGLQHAEFCMPSKLEVLLSGTAACHRAVGNPKHACWVRTTVPPSEALHALEPTHSEHELARQSHIQHNL